MATRAGHRPVRLEPARRNDTEMAMRRTMMKSKLHRATVTQADLHYVGSLTIDEQLMEAADLLPNEKVQVVALESGARLETYVIVGERGSGVVCANGAAARLIQPGDRVIIISYAEMEDAEARSWEPRVVLVDVDNRVERILVEAHGDVA